MEELNRIGVALSENRMSASCSNDFVESPPDNQSRRGALYLARRRVLMRSLLVWGERPSSVHGHARRHFQFPFENCAPDARRFPGGMFCDAWGSHQSCRCVSHSARTPYRFNNSYDQEPATGRAPCLRFDEEWTRRGHRILQLINCKIPAAARLTSAESVLRECGHFPGALFVWQSHLHRRPPSPNENSALSGHRGLFEGFVTLPSPRSRNVILLSAIRARSQL